MTRTLASIRQELPGQIDLTQTKHLALARRMQRIREEQKQNFRARGGNESSHLWGALGEIYVAEYLGVVADWEQKPTDEGVDGIFHGVTYDVKLSTFWSDPHLKVPVASKYWADIYILVAADMAELKLRSVGWATRKEVRSSEIKNYTPKGGTRQYPDNYVLPGGSLHPLDDLLKMRLEGALHVLKGLDE